MKQPTDNVEFQNEDNLNPNTGQEGDIKTYSEEEYKNAEAFGTKAQQALIDATERLVKSNPSELLEIKDAKLQNKIITNLYGASNIEELKIISPEIFKEDSNNSASGDYEEDELSVLQKKVKLMEYKNNQGAIKDAIDKLKISNTDTASTISNFEEKIRNEMQYFGWDLSIEEKAKRAFKLVAGSRASEDDAYLALQGGVNIKSNSQGSEASREQAMSNSPLAQAFANLR